MSTAAQITANQLNATHSTGPRTQEGKITASRNASTHGLASHTILSYECAADFSSLLSSIANEFHPHTETEYFLIAQMAQARWRIARINRLTTSTFDSLIGAADPECPDVRLAQAMAQLGADPVAKLQRYLNDAERSFYRAKRELENTRKLANKSVHETKPIQPLPEQDQDPEPTWDRARFAEIVTQLHARNKANPSLATESGHPKSRPPVR